MFQLPDGVPYAKCELFLQLVLPTDLEKWIHANWAAEKSTRTVQGVAADRDQVALQSKYTRVLAIHPPVETSAKLRKIALFSNRGKQQQRAE